MQDIVKQGKNGKIRIQRWVVSLKVSRKGNCRIAEQGRLRDWERNEKGRGRGGKIKWSRTGKGKNVPKIKGRPLFFSRTV